MLGFISAVPLAKHRAIKKALELGDVKLLKEDEFCDPFRLQDWGTFELHARQASSSKRYSPAVASKLDLLLT